MNLHCDHIMQRLCEDVIRQDTEKFLWSNKNSFFYTLFHSYIHNIYTYISGYIFCLFGYSLKEKFVLLFCQKVYKQTLEKQHLSSTIFVMCVCVLLLIKQPPWNLNWRGKLTPNCHFVYVSFLVCIPSLI